jgi:N6-adenosine-specific RNA methylase IME4
MTIDAIKALDIGSRAAEDSVLWLWTTNAHLPEAFGVAAAWGFIYKNTLTWDKQRMGLGDWLRGQTEHCLLCIRGNPTIDLTNQTTLLSAPARKHSQKPEEFYEMVEALCPGSKADVFARTQRDGWASYGDEVSA